jgi:trk system potassium uptake protein TrkH
MQWYGGLGIVIFSVAMVLRPGRATLGLARSEVPENELLGSTRLYARDICVIYGGLTVAGILLVWALEGGLFDAAAFVLAAVSTGGFAPHDASLAAYASPWARSVVIGLCLAGAVPLVFYDWWRPKRQGEGARVSLVQVVALGCCCAGLIGLLLGIPQGLPWLDAVVTALSAQSTAGFSTVDVGALDPGSKLTMIVSMLLGGGIGSTAGGFKILRLLVLGKIVYIMVTRSALAPHAVSRPTLGGMSLEQDAIIEAQVIIALYVGAVVASWVPFVLYGYAPFDALFEVVSAVGTVGLSAGITGPDLETPLKLVLCADMLLGRVEIFAWLVILYPRTWLGNRRSS